MGQQIVVYKPSEKIKMEVKTDGETVWLTIDQMSVLFGRDKSVIGKHVRNVFAEGELPQEGFRQILPKTSLSGGRPLALYSLDVVISVGYRVKSFEGVRLRQWATRVLRELLLNRLDEIKRIGKLERRVAASASVSRLMTLLANHTEARRCLRKAPSWASCDWRSRHFAKCLDACGAGHAVTGYVAKSLRCATAAGGEIW